MTIAVDVLKALQNAIVDAAFERLTCPDAPALRAEEPPPTTHSIAPSRQELNTRDRRVS